MKKYVEFKKVFLIVALFVTVFAFGMPLVKYFTITEGYDDCVKLYVRQLLDGEVSNGLVYELSEGRRHVDVSELPLPVIGTARQCAILIKDDPIMSLLETATCNTMYVLEKTKS